MRALPKREVDAMGVVFEQVARGRTLIFLGLETYLAFEMAVGAFLFAEVAREPNPNGSWALVFPGLWNGKRVVMVYCLPESTL